MQQSMHFNLYLEPLEIFDFIEDNRSEEQQDFWVQESALQLVNRVSTIRVGISYSHLRNRRF